MNTESFTEEELEFVKYYSVKQSGFRVLIFYISILAAPIGFAIYGFLMRDPVALFVAFLGVMFFVIWLVSFSMKSDKILSLVCDKVLKNEYSKLDENK